MRYIKIFIAGMVFPSIILPFLLFYVWVVGKTEVLTIPFLHFIPLIWGAWNVLYFAFLRNVLPGYEAVKLLLTGAILGFLLAIYGVFWLDMPHLLGIPHYLPLILGPIIYALFWLFIVNRLNKLFGVQEP